jgi:hypothetical protein
MEAFPPSRSSSLATNGRYPRYPGQQSHGSSYPFVLHRVQSEPPTTEADVKGVSPIAFGHCPSYFLTGTSSRTRARATATRIWTSPRTAAFFGVCARYVAYAGASVSACSPLPSPTEVDEHTTAVHCAPRIRRETVLSPSTSLEKVGKHYDLVFRLSSLHLFFRVSSLSHLPPNTWATLSFPS